MFLFNIGGKYVNYEPRKFPHSLKKKKITYQKHNKNVTSKRSEVSGLMKPRLGHALPDKQLNYPQVKRSFMFSVNYCSVSWSTLPNYFTASFYFNPDPKKLLKGRGWLCDVMMEFALG